jgi:hypothetical protein
MDHRYLSVGEVAQLLNMSEKFVYAHVRELPGFFKLGGRWFADRTVLEEELHRLAKRPKKGGGFGQREAS